MEERAKKGKGKRDDDHRLKKEEVENDIAPPSPDHLKMLAHVKRHMFKQHQERQEQEAQRKKDAEASIPPLICPNIKACNHRSPHTSVPLTSLVTSTLSSTISMKTTKPCTTQISKVPTTITKMPQMTNHINENDKCTNSSKIIHSKTQNVCKSMNSPKPVIKSAAGTAPQKCTRHTPEIESTVNKENQQGSSAAPPAPVKPEKRKKSKAAPCPTLVTVSSTSSSAPTETAPAKTGKVHLLSNGGVPPRTSTAQKRHAEPSVRHRESQARVAPAASVISGSSVKRHETKAFVSSASQLANYPVNPQSNTRSPLKNNQHSKEPNITTATASNLKSPAARLPNINNGHQPPPQPKQTVICQQNMNSQPPASDALPQQNKKRGKRATVDGKQPPLAIQTQSPVPSPSPSPASKHLYHLPHTQENEQHPTRLQSSSPDSNRLPTRPKAKVRSTVIDNASLRQQVNHKDGDPPRSTALLAPQTADKTKSASARSPRNAEQVVSCYF